MTGDYKPQTRYIEVVYSTIILWMSALSKVKLVLKVAYVKF